MAFRQCYMRVVFLVHARMFPPACGHVFPLLEGSIDYLVNIIDNRDKMPVQFLTTPCVPFLVNKMCNALSELRKAAIRRPNSFTQPDTTKKIAGKPNEEALVTIVLIT